MWLSPTKVRLRDRLLPRYRYVLVCDHQDIDEGQYEPISAIAGRTIEIPSERLSIPAVGDDDDDDQRIHTWRVSTGFLDVPPWQRFALPSPGSPSSLLR